MHKLIEFARFMLHIAAVTFLLPFVWIFASAEKHRWCIEMYPTQ